MQHLGGRFGDESLVALGVYYEGRALVKQARVREGLAMLDEAMLDEAMLAAWARGRLLPLELTDHQPAGVVGEAAVDDADEPVGESSGRQ
jgi:hypothetical protein